MPYINVTIGSTQIWDCNVMRRLRSMEGHTARVSSHSWNQHILSSGSRSGQIIHHDVRQRDHVVTILNGHTEEVYYNYSVFCNDSVKRVTNL